MTIKTGLHISHEAAKKLGGIGAVLSGVCNTEVYQNNFQKTIFYGPLFTDVITTEKELLGDNGKITFSSLKVGGKKVAVDELSEQFQNICLNYDIDIVYGYRTIYDEIAPDHNTEVQIVLVGIKNLRQNLTDSFKFQLWEKFQFESNNYHDWDCEQYIRIAVPLVDILKTLCSEQEEIVAFSHEYMGVASCLRLLLEEKMKKQTIFYAHEVSTARAIVEKIPGHDVSFYNLLERDIKSGKSLEERFGTQKNSYRSELIKLAVHFDYVLAVGDWVKMEYEYLQPKVAEDKIKIAYNGIPTNSLSYEKKSEARKRIVRYCEKLFNFTPDVIFTHVTRLVISKGLWRDVKFLEEMDKYFAKHNYKGCFILLSSLIAHGRDPKLIEEMEKKYGWPILHQEGWPDLIDYEKDVYHSLAIFNAKSQAIKGVFINQYGFSPQTTGNRIPENSSFSDLRYGSDVELGFSIYEPFGIAQIENVPYGGVSMISRQCGCSFLLDRAFADIELQPYYAIDFADTGISDEGRLITLSTEERNEQEALLFRENGKKMFELIPKTEEQRRELFHKIKERVSQLSWESCIKAIGKPFTD